MRSKSWLSNLVKPVIVWSKHFVDGPPQGLCDALGEDYVGEPLSAFDL